MGLTALLAGSRVHASRGRYYLPADEAKKAGLKADALRKGDGGQPLRDTARAVVRSSPQSSAMRTPAHTRCDWGERVSRPCRASLSAVDERWRFRCPLSLSRQAEAAEGHLCSARERRSALPAGSSGVFLPAVPADIFLRVRIWPCGRAPPAAVTHPLFTTDPLFAHRATCA